MNQQRNGYIHDLLIAQNFEKIGLAYRDLLPQGIEDPAVVLLNLGEAYAVEVGRSLGIPEAMEALVARTPAGKSPILAIETSWAEAAEVLAGHLLLPSGSRARPGPDGGRMLVIAVAGGVSFVRVGPDARG